MLSKTVQLKFSRGISTVIWTGDWHLGNGSVSMEALDCLHHNIKSRKLQWIHGADIIEGILPNDKRFSMDEKNDSLLEQIDQATTRLYDLRENCLGMLEGNHEKAPSKLIGSSENSVSSFICHKAKIPFLTQTCFLRFKAPKGDCVAFLTHRLPSITNNNEDPRLREANRSARLRKVFRPFQADLKLGAHIHTFLCQEPVAEDRLMLTDRNEIKKRGVSVYGEWAVVCPALFTTYGRESNYAQGSLYRPTDLGWAEIDFDVSGRIVEVRNVLGNGETKRAYRGLLVD